jgi:hypothetical protein
VAEAASTIQRMQKVLTEMNVQLANVLAGLCTPLERNRLAADPLRLGTPRILR